MSAFFKWHDSCILHRYVQIAQSVERPFNLRVQGSSSSSGATFLWGFPGSSAGKESTCNTGDSSSIPGSRRSAGEGIGYPLKCSWASLVAQLVKICPQCGRPGFDPWVGKIPWRRERLLTPVFWPGESHGLYSPWGRKESDTAERLSLSCTE